MAAPLKGRPPYILDTSVILAHLAAEPGAERLASFRESGAIPFMALSELYYIVWQRKGKAEADTVFGLVKGWKLPILLPEERIILLAGRLKATYKLGIADSYIASFALDRSGTLVTKDPDYNVLKDELNVHIL